MDRAGVAALIAEIPDYPLPGVVFKDVTPISGDPAATNWVNNQIAKHFLETKLTRIVGVEARGFILGASLATHMDLGFVPIRKSGKLPAPAYSESYSLEYGESRQLSRCQHRCFKLGYESPIRGSVPNAQYHCPPR